MLRIEEGKYYETADGVRVGPMYMWDEPGEMQVDDPWQEGSKGGNRFDPCGDIWRTDGTSSFGCPTLVREVP
jgi:hypothetical protein